MSGDISEFLELQKSLVSKDKVRLGYTGIKKNEEESTCQKLLPTKSGFRKELKLKPLDGNFEGIENKIASENLSDNKLVKCGEFSPNNPVNIGTILTAYPYLGIGEYELKRSGLREKERSEYLMYLAKKNDSFKELSKKIQNKLIVTKPNNHETKSVQTEIQNIHNPLVQYDIHSKHPPEKELSPRYSNMVENISQDSSCANGRLNQSATNAPNSFNNSQVSRKEKFPSRENWLTESSMPTFMDGFSNSDPNEEIEKEKFKKELYQKELLKQIQEKRRLQVLKEEQEKREIELENRRLQEQLLKMQEEQLKEKLEQERKKELMRKYNKDIMNRKFEMEKQRFHRGSEIRESKCIEDAPMYIPESKPLTNKKQNSSAYSRPQSARTPRSRSHSTSSVFDSESPLTKNRDILAQLGAIRKQLHMEQEKMDKLLKVHDVEDETQDC